MSTNVTIYVSFPATFYLCTDLMTFSLRWCRRHKHSLVLQEYEGVSPRHLYTCLVCFCPPVIQFGTGEREEEREQPDSAGHTPRGC